MTIEYKILSTATVPVPEMWLRVFGVDLHIQKNDDGVLFDVWPIVDDEDDIPDEPLASTYVFHNEIPDTEYAEAFDAMLGKANRTVQALGKEKVWLTPIMDGYITVGPFADEVEASLAMDEHNLSDQIYKMVWRPTTKEN